MAINKRRLAVWHQAPQLPFEKHDIKGHLDSSGRYALPFERDFPLSVRLFRYRTGQFTQGVTWHEQLELFCPVAGTIEVQMGDRKVELRAGDMLVMDNLKLHRVLDRDDLDARVVVVSFLPEFVCSLGSSSHDFTFLLPFYAKAERGPHVLRAGDHVAKEAAGALEHLAREFVGGPALAHREAGCKVWLLALLIILVRQFQRADILRWEFEKRRQLSQRLNKLLEHLQRAGSERIPLADAARLSGMSVAQFTRTFKKVAGMSYVAYHTRLRLAEAARLLRVSQRKIAEIAELTGFADQSHFDRRFKRAFGQTPRDYQRAAGLRP